MQSLERYKSFIFEKVWLVPTLISGFCLSVLFIIIYYDQVISSYFQTINSLIAIDKDTSTTVLSVLASSTISVISVIFSITILVLSNTSNKYGSRLLPTFMRQKITQYILGLFTGTFIYCLFAIFLMDSISVNSSTTRLLVLIAVVFGVICFASLAIFIHFVCNSIQSDNILLYLSNDLNISIDNYYSPLKGLSDTSNGHFDVSKKKNFTKKHLILSSKSGYVTSIDFFSLYTIACKNNCIVTLHIKPGSYILSSQIIITISYQDKLPSSELDVALLKLIIVENRRKHLQDMEFCLEEISEIALLALSPGVCNPYLAVHCINRLISGLKIADSKLINKSIFCDQEDIPRLIIKRVSGADLVKYSICRIRQQSESDLTIIIHLLKSLAQLYYLVVDADIKAEILNQANCLIEGLDFEKFCKSDQNTIIKYKSLIEKCMAEQ